MQSDAELLAAAASDPEALGRFYDRHEAAVLAYFMRRTRDPHVAADLAAETFAHVVAHCRKGRRVEEPLAWLFRIALNLLTDHHRRGRVADRARRAMGMERLIYDDDALERIEALGADPHTAELDAALAELEPDVREIVVERYVEDRGYDEIAAAHGLSEPAVRKRASRALARLRRRLGGEA